MSLLINLSAVDEADRYYAQRDLDGNKASRKVKKLVAPWPAIMEQGDVKSMDAIQTSELEQRIDDLLRDIVSRGKTETDKMRGKPIDFALLTQTKNLLVMLLDMRKAEDDVASLRAGASFLPASSLFDQGYAFGQKVRISENQANPFSDATNRYFQRTAASERSVTGLYTFLGEESRNFFDRSRDSEHDCRNILYPLFSNDKWLLTIGKNVMNREAVTPLTYKHYFPGKENFMRSRQYDLSFHPNTEKMLTQKRQHSSSFPLK